MDHSCNLMYHKLTFNTNFNYESTYHKHGNNASFRIFCTFVKPAQTENLIAVVLSSLFMM